MKRIIAFVLVAMMVLLFSVVAMAEEEPRILKFVGEPFTTKGDVHDVKLAAENMKDITMFQFAVVYDAEALAVKAVVPDARFTGCLVNYTTEPGVIYINWDEPSSRAVDISGTIVTITFEALVDNDGATKIDFHDDPGEFLLGDANFAEIPMEDIEIIYEHEHVYKDWKRTAEPACEEPGKEIGYCHVYEDCVASEIRIIDALGHDISDESWEETKPATCTEEGEETGICARCKKSQTRPTAPLGHEWDEWEVNIEPECEEPGEKIRTCDRCGGIETEIIDAFGHSWGEWEITTEPTCTEEGEETRICERENCGSEETRALEVLGHSWGEWEVTTEPTCTEKGEETRLCVRDNCESKETRSVDAIGHSWGEWLETTEPTCTEEGEEIRICERDNCESKVTRPVDAIGHEYGEWEVTTEPTCTEEGEESRFCVRDNCESKETRPVDAIGHSWGEWLVTTEPTCTEKGEESHYCERENCDYKETRGVAAKGHDWGEWNVTLAPTYTSEGEQNRTCKVCQVTENGVIPKLPTDITISSKTLVIGGKKNVTIGITEGSEVTCIQFAVKYDPAVLKVNSCTAGTAVSDATLNYTNSGVVYFVWDAIEKIDTSEILLDIEFTTAEGAVATETVVSIDTEMMDFIFADENGKEIRRNVTNGVVTVIDVIYGDVNGDEKVNVLDANIVRRYSARLASLDDNQIIAADVDGNGKINVLDSNLIRRYTARLISIFPVEEK